MMSQPSTLLLPLILNIIDDFESGSYVILALSSLSPKMVGGGELVVTIFQFVDEIIILWEDDYFDKLLMNLKLKLLLMMMNCSIF